MTTYECADHVLKYLKLYGHPTLTGFQMHRAFNPSVVRRVYRAPPCERGLRARPLRGLELGRGP